MVQQSAIMVYDHERDPSWSRCRKWCWTWKEKHLLCVCVDILDIPSIPGTTINQLPPIPARPLFIVWCTWRPKCMISYVKLHPFFTHNHEVFNDNIGTFRTASQLASNLAFKRRPALPASKLLAASCRWLLSGTARVQGRCRRAKTPWQWGTDRARGRQPIVPNVAF